MPKNQKPKKTETKKKTKKKHLGITRPKTNKPMSKRRRTKYNNKNFHVHYFFTAPKQQSNNAKECQHQNNVAGGLGRGPGPLGPQGPGLGPRQLAPGRCFFCFFLFSFCFFLFFFGFLFVFFVFFGFFLCFYRKSTSRARFPKPRKKKQKKKQKEKHLPGASCRGPSQDSGDPGGLGPGPGPRPHYFDVGTLLHCLIAALEL